MFNNAFLLPFENCAIYEIMQKNILESDRPQMTIWRMRIACWIPKGTITHREYVIIIAFPLQQWLQGRASVLRYAYITCLVVSFCESSLRELLDS